MLFHYFVRQADGGNPAGVTVSKVTPLPAGDFQLDEYLLDGFALWFVESQEFTELERKLAFRGLKKMPELWELARA